jgi:PAS domain S-box-containing protein
LSCALATLPRLIGRDEASVSLEIEGRRAAFHISNAGTARFASNTEHDTRLRTEEALQVSEARHRALTENTVDLVCEFDVAGIVQYVSPSVRDILGYEQDELIGTSFVNLIHTEDIESACATDGDTLTAHSKQMRCFRARSREGEWRWLDCSIGRYRVSDGVEHIVSVMRDVTESRLVKEQLRESEERLLQSQKMETIGRLAGGGAHDFNNLLTAITGYCDLMLDELGPDQAMRSDAEEIIRAAERAGALTRQLLAFSRQQSLQPTLVDLDGLVSNVDRLLRRLIGEDIELVTSLNSAVERVRVDTGQMEQLVMNLAVNARDAMPQGGRLTITTQPVDVTEGSELAQLGIPIGRHVSLQVYDTGIGMNEATVSRVFEPFFTTKEAGKETGLSTVYGIVQQSGGQIRVDSEVGAYTNFMLYFPIVDATEEEIAPEVVHVELAGTESLLLVEDEDSVRRLLRRCFEKHGYTVADAASGSEALRALTESKPFDLLITDLVLPKMSGPDLARRLRRHVPGIQTLYISGFSNEVVSARFEELEADAVLLQKPFTGADVLVKVREILDARAEQRAKRGTASKKKRNPPTPGSFRTL